MKRRTQQDYHIRIGRVIAAILKDPGADHRVETLAAIAALSPFHFHRIYRAMTGEGVAETVRRIRLARAARALGETDETVTQVAIDAGYDSSPAFARAFRQFAGISPSAFQADRRLLTETADGYVRLLRIAPMRVLALRHEGPLESIGQSYHRLVAMLGAVVPLEMLAHRVGLSVGDPEGGDSFSYHAGVMIEDDGVAPAGLAVMDIPGGLYAAYRHVGSYGLITPAYRLLFGRWLPRSGHELDDRPVLEFYRSPWAWGNRADCVTELMIPVKEP